MLPLSTIVRISLAATSSQRLRRDAANLSVFTVCDNQSHLLEPSWQGQNVRDDARLSFYWFHLITLLGLPAHVHAVPCKCAMHFELKQR